MLEEEILNAIIIEQELSKLPPVDADMLLLLYKIRQPEGYEGPWPPKITDIGIFIGLKYKGKPMNEATIRYRHRKLKKLWQMSKT